MDLSCRERMEEEDGERKEEEEEEEEPPPTYFAALHAQSVKQMDYLRTTNKSSCYFPYLLKPVKGISYMSFGGIMDIGRLNQLSSLTMNYVLCGHISGYEREGFARHIHDKLSQMIMIEHRK